MPLCLCLFTSPLPPQLSFSSLSTATKVQAFLNFSSAMAKKKKNRLSYISVPTQVIEPLSSSSFDHLLLSPKKTNVQKKHPFSPKTLLIFLFLFALMGTIKIGLLLPFFPLPCPSSTIMSEKSNPVVNLEDPNQVLPVLGKFNGGNVSEPESESDSEFWKQPDGMGYKPCLKFSREYRRETQVTMKNRRKYLVVVVAGGMNQQRNQIVDAVVIARILGASLVVPILQVNVVWGDESEFSDIFDVEHFKRVLADDVRIVSSLPSTHLMSRPVEEKQTPLHVSAPWIRSRYLRKLNKEGVLLLRGLDSRLAKNLPPDLQKLRCKVAFHGLRFAAPIMQLGNLLATRMRSKGPYLSLHLRMEKDVWIRTGCFPGLSSKHDKIIQDERKRRPELLTGRSHMTYHDRKLAGLCPLTAVEVARLLKALGAPRNASIYWAGGEPFGGAAALLPLTREFPNFYNKDNIALPGELKPFANKSSLLAAVDYIVAENSNVFMPSHGGNMGRAMQGHRAYAGHKKYITPNKRQMISYFLNSSLPESEFNRIIKELHRGSSLGQPDTKMGRISRDVTAYPAPECMCNTTISIK